MRLTRKHPEGRVRFEILSSKRLNLNGVLRYVLVFALGIVVSGIIRAGMLPAEVHSRLSTGDVEKILFSTSDWGRWGAQDQLGTVNLITPDKRREAAGLVREGVSVSMARNLVSGTPTFQQKMTSTGTPDSNHAADIYTFDYHGSNLTHLDALCHIFYHGKVYNGYPQSIVTSEGATKLSVLNMKNGLFTRAVLMDMPALWGVKYLPPNKVIYPADLEAWERKSGFKLEKGDAILLNTGRWDRQSVEGQAALEKAAAGLHATCLPWLKQRGIAIVGSDFATDLIPSGVAGFDSPIHVGVINALGTPILDNLDFSAVSEYARAHKRWAFLLTANPLAVQGGTGSPINPVATF